MAIRAAVDHHAPRTEHLEIVFVQLDAGAVAIRLFGIGDIDEAGGCFNTRVVGRDVMLGGGTKSTQDRDIAEAKRLATLLENDDEDEDQDP